jgi:hypothetical protein
MRSPRTFTAVPAILLLAVATGVATSSAYALPPGPEGAPPPPASTGIIVPPVAQGQVKRMLTNPYGEVDGLRLADGTIVKFPPHMSNALAETVKPGQMIRVFGRPESRDAVKADVIVNLATSQTLFDQPPAVDGRRPLPPHLRARSLQVQKVEGRIDAVLTGPRGEANGVILVDGSIVRFPPESLRLSMQQGASFAASGLGTSNAYGMSLEAVSVGTSLATLQPIYDRIP